jgi:lipooligosaccharide transport system permease protein
VLEVVAWAMPLSHGVALCRQLTLGDVDPASAVGHLSYLLVFTAVGLGAAYYSYRRRLVV